MQTFQKNITLPSGLSNVLTLLVAAGYAGTANTIFYKRKVESCGAAGVSFGNSSMAATTDGDNVQAGDSSEERGMDLSKENVYDPAGGAVISFRVGYL
jgi:hypothetical protein